MKYDILEADTREDLANLVNKNVKNDWIISGSAFTESGRFYQPIYHKSDGDPKPQTIGEEDDLLKIAGFEGCPICGESDCSNKMHSDLAEIATLMKGLKGVKK